MNLGKRTGLLLLALAVLWAVLPLAVKAEDGVVLDEITVKGEAITTESQPITVDVVDKEKIQELKIREPEKILEEVPGIDIHRYGMGGVANEFTIRGFNNAGHGGDAAIAIDGIILNEGQSHADGYADMNVIIPLELDHVEVFKGPSSPLFGNFARGGAISFFTRKTGEYNTLETSAGSFNTYDAQYALGHALSKTVQLNAALQLNSTRGYQDNSSWQRYNFSGRLAWQLTPDLDVAVSARVHHSVWDAPGYIPKAQFDSGSMQQAVNAENDGGKKAFTTEKIELGYNLNLNNRILAWTYATQQDFTRFAKFGYDPGGQTEKFNDRKVYGVGASYNYLGLLANKELSAVAGIEYLHENTLVDQWNTSNRVRTAQTVDGDFIINTASAFGEVNYALHPLFNPWIGLRYDSFSGNHDDNSPGVAPSSNNLNDYSHFSPKIGFRSTLHKTLEFKASYSQGFALPADALKYNSALGTTPETINQYEAGLKYKPSDILSADLTVYRIDTKNELQESPPGSGIYANLGETRRDGLEFSTVVRPGIDGLEVFGNATLMHTEITKNADATLDGKQITNVPNFISELGLRYKMASGFNGMVKWRHAGKYYVDSANTITYKGYDVTDVSVGYEAKTDTGKKWRITLAADNVFDSRYSQAVFQGFGTINYAVSPPRTCWLKLGMDF